VFQPPAGQAGDRGAAVEKETIPPSTEAAASKLP